MVLDDSVMRRSDALKEMMGLARMIIADGHISDAEMSVFRAWMAENPDVAGLPQVDELVEILKNFFADGELSDEERSDLIEVLERFGG